MTDTDLAAPLATLENMIGNTVTVRTKDGQLIDGTLASYDEHLNLTLKASPTTDTCDTDDDPQLIRGTHIVAITNPPIDNEAPVDASNTTPDVSDRKPSPALAELKTQLEPKNLTVNIDADGDTLRVTKLGQEYRIHPDGTVRGDGPHREQLEQFLTD